MAIQFLVHEPDDLVGVVVEDVQTGQELSGWVMEGDHPHLQKRLSPHE